MFAWAGSVPIEVWGLALLVAALVAGAAGRACRVWFGRGSAPKKDNDDESGQEAYVVSGVLGLLALLMAFSLSMAVDRFDFRRAVVLEEANAIGTAYLRAQLLPEPHRTRLSELLRAYTTNRIELANADGGDEMESLLARNDDVLTDIWAATAAGFDAVSNLDFSSTFVESINNVIDSDEKRKAARLAHIPTEVLVLLSLYLLVAAWVLGHVLDAPRSRFAGVIVIALFGSSLFLIFDLDGARTGGIQESQGPMLRLRDDLQAQPPKVFDRWRANAISPN